MKRIGFLVNPIAGMGGRVGLKGTDDAVARAVELGARPTAHLRAGETLCAMRALLRGPSHGVAVQWLTCSGGMGADALRSAGFSGIEIVHQAAEPSTDQDTKSAVRRFLEREVDLILFCGGDGTARDICALTAQGTPILGIPAGVKMYSGVFGVSPARTAEIAIGFLEGSLTPISVDVLDLDEERYRRGEWAVRLCASALTPYEPTLTQSAKMLFTASTEAEVKAEIADYLLEMIQADPDTLFLLGPGSTVQTLGERLGIDKTLLGIDAVIDGKLVGKDLDERRIVLLLDQYPSRKLVLSPIGAQGFVLGRGNLQITPEIIRRCGRRNVIVIATPAKLARTPLLRFDTGDANLDTELIGTGFVPVIIGDHRRRLVRAAA